MTRRLARCPYAEVAKRPHPGSRIVVLLSSARWMPAIPANRAAATRPTTSTAWPCAATATCTRQSAASRLKVRVGDQEERARNQHDGQDRGHADNRRVLAVVRLLDL